MSDPLLCRIGLHKWHVTRTAFVGTGAYDWYNALSDEMERPPGWMGVVDVERVCTRCRRLEARNV